MRPSRFLDASGLSLFRRLISQSLPALILLLAVVADSCAAEPVPLIPIETFFRLPAIAQVKLSPEGDYIAYAAPYERRQNLFVRRIGDPEAIRLTNSTIKDVGAFFWIGNDRLAYASDEGSPQIRVIGRDGTGDRALTSETGASAALVAQFDDTHLLVKMSQRDPRVQDLHKLDVNTGTSEVLVKNDRNYVGYVADNSGLIRLAVATDGVNFALFHRATSEAPFERVLTTDFRATVTPLFFTQDNRYVYALSNRNRDKAAVVLLDPRDGTELEVIYQHAEYDAAGLIRDERKERIVGAYYIGEKNQRVYFDERARNREFDLMRLLPGKALEFAGSSRAGTDFIVKAWAIMIPGRSIAIANRRRNSRRLER